MFLLLIHGFHTLRSALDNIWFINSQAQDGRNIQQT